MNAPSDDEKKRVRALRRLYSKETVLAYCTTCRKRRLIRRKTTSYQKQEGKELILTHTCETCDAKGFIIWRAAGGLLFVKYDKD